MIYPQNQSILWHYCRLQLPLYCLGFGLIFIVVFLMSPLSVKAQALENKICECPKGSSTLAKSFETSDVVFVGQVLEIQKDFGLHPGYDFIRFLPLKTFKGEEFILRPESLVIFTPTSDDPCSLKFSKRNDYLVFAKGKPAFLTTNACERTGMQEVRGEDIRSLTEKRK